ncbi:hypothetical protein K438DRAFT_1981783 [Mycena galopus ATCC 62051]|nr:hypothetical protein K438DRAFT_1981783 [Mycena galopus ATCC 62051]
MLPSQAASVLVDVVAETGTTVAADGTNVMSLDRPKKAAPNGQHLSSSHAMVVQVETTAKPNVRDSRKNGPLTPGRVLTVLDLDFIYSEL